MKPPPLLCCLLWFLLSPAFAQEIFEKVKVKVGRRTCVCSFTLESKGSTEQSSGSCDKKCSGSVSGFALTGERHLYTLDFAVKKGKVALKVLQVTTLTPTTQSGGSGSGEASPPPPGSCPSGFRQVCSMVGSCPLGTAVVCPPGHEVSGQAHMPLAAECRCVPFFLLQDLETEETRGAQLLDRLALGSDLEPMDISVEAIKLELGSKTCTCSFFFTVSTSLQVSSSRGKCDKKCSGHAKGVEARGTLGVVSFDLSVKKGKVKIGKPIVLDIFTTTTTTTTPAHPQTTNSEESSSNGCLCVDQGPATQEKLTFNETGETHVQEQIFIEETGILEIHVPPHSNYSESVYLVSEEAVLLSTNHSCQLSEAPQNLSQKVLGLPLPWRVPDSDTYHVVKARKTRLTNSKRQSLMYSQRAECRKQAVTRTEDFSISAEDYRTMQEGGFVTVKDDASTRGCLEAHQCTSVGPHACGYTGWTNPATGVGFTFHQVSTGSICVTCRLEVHGPSDLCNPNLCWCSDITDKEKLMDCAFILEPRVPLQIEDSQGKVFNQTMTYSGEEFNEKSIKIEVPPHQGGETAFDQLTVVMHAATFGYWHHYSLKDNMLFKRKDQCLITTLPSSFFPVDGALGMKEIVDVVKEEDSLVQHSVLVDAGEMTTSEVDQLGAPILAECHPSSDNFRRVREEKVSGEEAKTLENGGVVFLPQESNRACNIMTAVTQLSGANCWYWPNPGTGANVALHNVIHGVEQLTCCENLPGPPGPCCNSTYPHLCLCEDIVSQQDFLDCLDAAVTTTTTTTTTSTGSTSNGVLVIGGGYSGRFTIETYPAEAKVPCSIPQFPAPGRYRHSLHVIKNGDMNGNVNNQLVACGGQLTKTSCISWHAGQPGWTHYATLNQKRGHHGAVVMPNDVIILVGGDDSQMTGEIVNGDQFPLRNHSQGTCASTYQKGFVVIGGASPMHGKVDRYNSEGAYLDSLPDLAIPRFFHACTTFVSSEGEEGLLVAGGKLYPNTESSTELYLPSANRWTRGGNLPRKLAYPKAALLNQQVILTGGAGGGYRKEVVHYSPLTDTWEEIGEMTTGRSGHAMVEVDRDTFCIAI